MDRFPASGLSAAVHHMPRLASRAPAARPAPVLVAQATGDGVLSDILSDGSLELEVLSLLDIADDLGLPSVDGLCAEPPFLLSFVVNRDMSSVCAAAERLVAVAGGIDGPTGAVPGALGRGFFGGAGGGPSPFQVAFSALNPPAGFINKFRYPPSSFRVNQGPNSPSFSRRGGSDTFVTTTIITVPFGDAGTGALGLVAVGAFLYITRRASRARPA
ncbi:hypothetical protein [Mongoliimonas terrestris]|uniref:hypothetical protein n=1 Tax=Mongoliimonas terrestris TaxID=1709001 RepID=UPI00111514B7|nr:hypothetical protein [Mongoliimonas terrestris]